MQCTIEKCIKWPSNEYATSEIASLAGVGRFSVDKALDIIRTENVERMTLNWKTIKQFKFSIPLDINHSFHINLNKYGIIGTYIENGEEYNFILDGNNRAKIKLIRRQSFKVYVLNLEQTRKCYIGKRAPKGLRFVK
jgi:hypothetical protein